MDREASKDSVHKDNTAARAKKLGLPSGKATIERRDKRLIVTDPEFVQRQGEPEIRLGEGRDRRTQVVGHQPSSIPINCIGTKVDLWKLMCRPVAGEKLSRTFFRFVTPSMSPFIRMSLSSAYWRTG